MDLSSGWALGAGGLLCLRYLYRGILPAHRACGAATAGTLHGGALHDDALHGHPLGGGTYLPAPHPAPKLRHVSGYAPATRQPLHRASRRCPLAGLSRLPPVGPRHHLGPIPSALHRLATHHCATHRGDPPAVALRARPSLDGEWGAAGLWGFCAESLPAPDAPGAEEL